MKVLPLAAHGLMRLGEQDDCLAPPIAPLLMARDTTLGRFQCALGFAVPAGREDARTVRTSGERLDAKVYPRFLPGSE